MHFRCVVLGKQNEFCLRKKGKTNHIISNGMIKQNMLIIGGRDDHMIMPHLFHEEYDLLPNVRSLAFHLYSNRDDAGSHCGIGNMELILDTVVSWVKLMNKKGADK